MRTALPDPTLNPGLSIRGSVFSRYLDVMLAFGVIAVVALMIVRVPQWLVDVFIAVNMSVSALVLLVALYAQDARKLPSFPTVLLLTTLENFTPQETSAQQSSATSWPILTRLSTCSVAYSAITPQPEKTFSGWPAASRVRTLPSGSVKSVFAAWSHNCGRPVTQ